LIWIFKQNSLFLNEMKTDNIISIMEVVSGTTTNADAMPLYLLLKKKLSNNQGIMLSFRNSTPLSSSFLNTAIGNLVDDFGLDYVKSHLKIIQCPKTVLNSLKRYFDNLAKLEK